VILKSGQRGPDVCEMAGLAPEQWPDVFESMVEIMAGPKEPACAPVDWDAKFAELAGPSTRPR
jgi:hypothetical protein